MENPAYDDKKENNKSLMKSEGAGSDYHREHAGHVEGYGQPYPNTEHATDKNEQ